MITHSLLERGFTFQEAYQVAASVKSRLRRRRLIEKDELVRLIQEVVRQKLGREFVRDAPAPRAAGGTILIHSEGRAVPFSKGLLAQSLQASGLEPSAAYDVAREIEDSLLQMDLTELPREQLRQIIYETIVRKYDPKFAERYLLWRYFKSPDKPLIILIGGATGTGKSTIAAEIAHRIGIRRILATDTVRQIMRMMFSRDLLPAIHYSSYEAWKDRVHLGEDKAEAVVEAFKEQSERVLVGVRAMVGRAIEENFSLVIEGVHLVPGLMDLDPFEKGAYLVHLVISTLNRDSYLDRFPSRQREAAGRSVHRYRKNFENILLIQDYVLEMAEHYDTPTVENIELDKSVSAALMVITSELREKVKISSRELAARVL
jgi:2-phosphoglycerate kinase